LSLSQPQRAQGTWAHTNIDKSQSFANYLPSVFEPNSSNTSPGEEEPIIFLLEPPYHLELPRQRFKHSEIETVVNNLFPKTLPCHDLITGKTLQELPPVAIKLITQLF
jgi:hypothetical protein